MTRTASTAIRETGMATSDHDPLDIPITASHRVSPPQEPRTLADYPSFCDLLEHLGRLEQDSERARLEALESRRTARRANLRAALSFAVALASLLITAASFLLPLMV